MDSEDRIATEFLLVALLAVTVWSGSALAHPGTHPDHQNETGSSSYHGVNRTLFPLLWSGDIDGNVTTDPEASTQQAAFRQLAEGTDIPLASPPRAVEQWNRGELRQFPHTTRHESLVPAGISTTDGRFIKDAHTSIFTVQPSTQAWIAPDNQPLYIGNRGQVLGTLDYRIELPDDDTDGRRQVDWTLLDHHLSAPQLIIDGRPVTTARPSQTPSFEFALDDIEGRHHTVRIVATVTVDLQKHIRTVDRTCETINNETVCRKGVTHRYSYPSERLRLADSRRVTEYRLDVSGYRARHPDGDLGLALRQDGPWLGHSLPGADQNVRGVWRLYSARDPDWDRLTRRTRNGSEQVRSPSHPLQLHAYPSAAGLSVPRPTATLTSTSGDRHDTPTLPDTVNLDTVSGSYSASHLLVTRLSEGSLTPAITIHGLVRGSNERIHPADLTSVQVNRSSLSTNVVTRTPENVTVRLHLIDQQTGTPIVTKHRDGYVLVNDRRLNTSENGTATVTIEGNPGVLTARFKPGEWWRNPPGYTSTANRLTLKTPGLQAFAGLFRASIPIGLLLLAIYLIDRITTWRVWPPWGRL